MSSPTLLIADTHAHNLQLALQLTSGERIQQVNEQANAHSQELLPSIEQLLQAHQLSPIDIDIWGVVRGPGSFTGIRIGLMAIRTLAYSTQKPCYGLSALKGLAAQTQSDKATLCLIDARHGHVYAQFFGTSKETLCKPLYLPIQEALSLINQDCYIIGTGSLAFEDEIASYLAQSSWITVNTKMFHLDSLKLINLALEQHSHNPNPELASSTPLYLVSSY